MFFSFSPLSLETCSVEFFLDPNYNLISTMVISLESRIGMKERGDSFKRNRLKTSSVLLFSIRVAQWGMNELFFHQMNTNKQENKGSQRLLSNRALQWQTQNRTGMGGSGFHWYFKRGKSELIPWIAKEMEFRVLEIEIGSNNYVTVSH